VLLQLLLLAQQALGCPLLLLLLQGCWMAAADQLLLRRLLPLHFLLHLHPLLQLHLLLLLLLG
jgi:hypothetical protein